MPRPCAPSSCRDLHLPRHSLSCRARIARRPQHLHQAVPDDRWPRRRCRRAVSQVMAEPILYHRAPAFIEVYARALERLPKVFQTKNQVLCFAASGTGGMESAVANLVGPGEPCARRLGGQVRRALGRALRRLRRRPHPPRGRVGRERRPRSRSTRPRRDWSARRTSSSSPSRRPRPASSTTPSASPRSPTTTAPCSASTPSPALGAVDLRQDEWGVDVVVSGSQKSLMTPARPRLRLGLRARHGARRRAPRRPLLLRLGQTADGPGREPPNSPFTPAVTLFLALDVALGLIFEEGLDGGPRPARDPRPRCAGRNRGARPRALRPRRRRRQRGHRREPARRDRRRRGAEADARPLRGHRRRRAGAA